MIGMTVKKVGFEKVDAALRAYKKRADGPFKDPAFADYVGSAGDSEIIKHFRQESGPDGRWPELAESTKKRRKASSPKMLQVTGRMRGATKWRKYGKDALIFINMSKYSATHNYGRPPVGGFRATIPQREFMWFAKGFLKKAVKAYAKYVINGRP